VSLFDERDLSEISAPDLSRASGLIVCAETASLRANAARKAEELWPRRAWVIFPPSKRRSSARRRTAHERRFHRLAVGDFWKGQCPSTLISIGEPFSFGRRKKNEEIREGRPVWMRIMSSYQPLRPVRRKAAVQAKGFGRGRARFPLFGKPDG